MSIFEPLTQCGCEKADCWHCGRRKLSPWLVPGLPPCDVTRYVQSKLMTPEDVFQEVCRRIGADPDAVKSKSRKREYVIPRQVYCFKARAVTKSTLIEIGRVVGYDHAMVKYSCDEVENKKSKDRLMRCVYEKVKGSLMMSD